MPRPSASRKLFRRLLQIVAAITLALLAVYLLALFGLRWVDPPTTAVQIERRIGSIGSGRAYRKEYKPVPLERISPALRHAVIAAEDSRFYRHHGIDFTELEKVVDETVDEGRLGRGASTISQQLVKNLFLTTRGSIVRKAAEFVLAPLADVILGKERVIELYLNVIEWGPGVYGAEAAARHHYGTGAASLTREQAARLAACLPNPRRRTPARMGSYSARILERMRQMGW